MLLIFVLFLVCWFMVWFFCIDELNSFLVLSRKLASRYHAVYRRRLAQSDDALLSESPVNLASYFFLILRILRGNWIESLSLLDYLLAGSNRLVRIEFLLSIGTIPFGENFRPILEL